MLNLVHLKVLAAVARHGSVTEAARELRLLFWAYASRLILAIAVCRSSALVASRSTASRTYRQAV
jgi:molybdenum-dependent DNA-binding transcriptional regulator ModE